MQHPVYRALVTYSDNTTGEIRIKIPSLLGVGSEVSISYIGRKSNDGIWTVPTAGDQIVVTSDDENLTNIFWVQTDGEIGPPGPAGGWQSKQVVAPITTSTLTSSSVGKFLYNTAACTVTVDSTTAFQVGESVEFARLDAGSFTIAQGSGATVNYTPANTLRAHYSSASLICTSSNTYLLVGDLG